MAKGKGVKRSGADTQTVTLESDSVGFLVQPKASHEFWQSTWEQEPAVFKATTARKDTFDGVLTYDAFVKLVDAKEEDGDCLSFQLDVVAMKYVEGERKDMTGEDVVDRRTIESLWADGATLQFHQPQRYEDVSYRTCAALERDLGCLVGCNAYITPAGAQGLAPHWDDVELFVCQTSGTKRWKVYAPLEGCELASVSSPDLDRDDLGECILDVVLQPGDVLYLPRGTVHEAVAEQAAPSSHLTFSTYQAWSWADLLERVTAKYAGTHGPGLSFPMSLRAGLPRGFLYEQGVQRSLDKDDADGVETDDNGIVVTAAAAGAAKQLAAKLRDLAALVEAHPEVITAVADTMAVEFMGERLPPPADSLPEGGPEPALDSLVCCRAKGMFRIVASEDDSEDEEDDEDLPLDFFTKALAGVPDVDMAEGGEEKDDDEEDEEGDEEGKAAKAKEAFAELKHKLGGEAGDGDGEGTDDEEQDDDEDDDGDVRIITCLYNERETHMVDAGDSDEEGDESEDDEARAGDGDGAGPAVEEEGDEAPELVKMGEDSGVAALAPEKRAELLQKLAAAGAGGKGGAKDDGDDGDSSDYEEIYADEPIKDMHVPYDLARAAAQLLACVDGKTMRVQDLDVESDKQKMELVLALHQWGAVATVQGAAAKGKAGARAAPAKKEKAKEAVADDDDSGEASGGGAAEPAAKPAGKVAKKADKKGAAASKTDADGAAGGKKEKKKGGADKGDGSAGAKERGFKGEAAKEAKRAAAAAQKLAAEEAKTAAKKAQADAKAAAKKEEVDRKAAAKKEASEAKAAAKRAQADANAAKKQAEKDANAAKKQAVKDAKAAEKAQAKAEKKRARDEVSGQKKEGGKGKKAKVAE